MWVAGPTAWVWGFAEGMHKLLHFTIRSKYTSCRMVASYISIASNQRPELRFCMTSILAMKVLLFILGQKRSNLVLFLVQELPAQPTHQLPAPDAYLKIPTAKEVGKLKDRLMG